MCAEAQDCIEEQVFEFEVCRELISWPDLCRQIAARTLGDLVRKLGEKILPEIIPILEEGLRSQKSDERQGVCIGLSEIMKSTSRDAVSIFQGRCRPCTCR